MRSKFTEPKEAFDFYDEDKDGFLTKNDFKNLLKEANVSILIRGLFAEFMLQSFDKMAMNWMIGKNFKRRF